MRKETQQQQITEALHGVHAIIRLVIEQLETNDDLPAHRVATSHSALVVASQALDSVWDAYLRLHAEAGVAHA